LSFLHNLALLLVGRYELHLQFPHNPIFVFLVTRISFLKHFISINFFFVFRRKEIFVDLIVLFHLGCLCDSLIVYANNFGSMPLPVFLAQTIDKHALLKFSMLIFGSALPFLGNFKKFLLNLTMNQNWDPRQNYIEIIFVLQDKFNKGTKADGIS